MFPVFFGVQTAPINTFTYLPPEPSQSVTPSVTPSNTPVAGPGTAASPSNTPVAGPGTAASPSSTPPPYLIAIPSDLPIQNGLVLFTPPSTNVLTPVAIGILVAVTIGISVFITFMSINAIRWRTRTGAANKSEVTMNPLTL